MTIIFTEHNPKKCFSLIPKLDFVLPCFYDSGISLGHFTKLYKTV